ncbi:unnamed protein product, partial [Rotaria sp. Silwood2]
MALQNNGQFVCPKRDGTKVEGNDIEALIPNEAVHQLVQLFDHPELTAPMCHRCNVNKAEHWCDSD